MKVEKVALDATLWDEPTTGIGLYARELAAALTRLGVKVERFGARESGEAPRRTPSRSVYALNELPEALKQSDAPMFHAVGNFNLPLLRVRGKHTVLTVHDVIPDLMPETVSRAFKWQFRLWLSRSLQVADRVICVSERTRIDLLRRFEVDASRVCVVHNGVDHVDRIPPPDRTGEQYLESLALPPQFILYAGSLDTRKNVSLVLDAVEILRRQGRTVPLVLAGQSWFGAGPVEKRVAQMRADGVDLRPLGYLSPSLFYAVMRKATVFAFPSRYEGFGLPPLEAMRLGLPTIVSNAGSLPEVCGAGALSIRPDDAMGLARALDRVLTDSMERARLIELGQKQAAGFTWERTARQTLQAYEDALRS